MNDLKLLPSKKKEWFYIKIFNKNEKEITHAK